MTMILMCLYIEIDTSSTHKSCDFRTARRTTAIAAIVANMTASLYSVRKNYSAMRLIN